MENILTTHALTKSYRHTKALSGVTMHVPKGAIYGFVGRNGAGKTTLMRLVTGLQHPTSGYYTLFGQKSISKDISLARRRMAAVIEKPAIYSDMTAEENLIEQCKVLGLPRTYDLNETLQMVGLHNTGKKKAKNFSLGMKQRLGIAVALIGSPDLLLLDEPANGLDPEGIIEIREIILNLNREHEVTVLISSHILDELSRIATCYGFINQGRLVKEISAQELQEECRKCMQVTVSNAEAFTRTLDQLGLSYRITSEDTAEIYGPVEVTDLVEALAQNGCRVKTMTEKGQRLEAYYLNLIGGGKDA